MRFVGGLPRNANPARDEPAMCTRLSRVKPNRQTSRSSYVIAQGSIDRADHSHGCLSSRGQTEHQLPGLILIVLAAACSALGTVNRSTPFVRLASTLSASKSPDSVKSHAKSPIWYSW